MDKEDKNDIDDIEEQKETLTDAEEKPAQESSAEEASDESSRIMELEDRYVRLFAEYDNFRKRTTKEKEELYRSAVAEVTGRWLSVLDNIDRAIDAARKAGAAEDGQEDGMLQGLLLIRKQAEDVLSKIDVTKIECGPGTAFDPNLHEAVMHSEDDSLGENVIAQVFQDGYIMKDKVIRHAVVKVAN